MADRGELADDLKSDPPVTPADQRDSIRLLAKDGFTSHVGLK
jgi:hypothetical protein